MEKEKEAICPCNIRLDNKCQGYLIYHLINCEKFLETKGLCKFSSDKAKRETAEKFIREIKFKGKRDRDIL